MKKFALTFVAAFSALGIAAQTSTRCAVFFPSDKYDLNQETCSTLDTLISFLNGKKSITVSITGHTDSTATEAYNQTLSKNRARTVTVYLAGKGIDPACITFIGLGEGSPVAGNNTEEGRQKNRRVELLVSWAAPEKPKRHGSGFALETEKKQKTWDSVLFTDNGIIVKIDKCSFDRELSEIDFNITGALYKDDMLANNLTTVDNNGNCLVSGGMVLLEAWYNGMQIDMNGGCPIEINIPSDRVDPQMDIYKSKTYEEGNVVWEKTKIVTDDEEGYYSFPITSLGGYNVDKKAPLQVVKEITIGNLQALADRIMDLFSYDGLVVKAKIPGNRRVYMCYNEPNSVVDGRSFRRNKYRFRSVCGGDLNEAEVAFKTRSNAGYSYRLARLEDVKYSRFRNLYIVRKKDLMATESSGLMSRAD